MMTTNRREFIQAATAVAMAAPLGMAAAKATPLPTRDAPILDPRHHAIDLSYGRGKVWASADDCRSSGVRGIVARLQGRIRQGIRPGDTVALASSLVWKDQSGAWVEERWILNPGPPLMFTRCWRMYARPE